MQQLQSQAVTVEEQTPSSSQEINPRRETGRKRNQPPVQCPKQKVHTDILFITMIILELLMYLVEERPFLSRLFFFLVLGLLLAKFFSWIYSTFCQKVDDNINLSFIDIHQNSSTPPPSSVVESDSHVLHLNNQIMSDVSSPVLSEPQLSSYSDLPPYHIALTLPQPSNSILSLPEHVETPPPTYERYLEINSSTK